MLASGAAVALWDIDAAQARARRKATLGSAGRVSTDVVELTDEAAVAAATGAHDRRSTASIDILVNNAGITGGNGTTWELAPDVWRRVIEVNLVAPYLDLPRGRAAHDRSKATAASSTSRRSPARKATRTPRTTAPRRPA